MDISTKSKDWEMVATCLGLVRVATLQSHPLQQVVLSLGLIASATAFFDLGSTT
jgi:hypothetical protein